MSESDVIPPAEIAELERVAAGERARPSGSLVGVRHPGSADEQRDDSDVLTTKGGPDLEANEVLVVGDARLASTVRQRRPRGPPRTDRRLDRAVAIRSAEPAEVAEEAARGGRRARMARREAQ